MAVKKKAPYGAGKCKVCELEYSATDEVYMDKVNDVWIICKDKECYDKQGGGEIKESNSGKQWQPTKFKLDSILPIQEATKGYVTEILKDCETETEKASVDCKVQLYESIFKSISGNFRP
jgi:hypothetical protein